MKIEVLSLEENKTFQKEVSNMGDIREIIGGEHEVVKIRPDLKVLYIANLKSQDPVNPNYPPYRGVVVKVPEEIVYKGEFYGSF